MQALPEVLESQLLRSLREIGIPPRPLILERIVTEIRKEEPDLRTLARIIGADVGISGSLLKIVNSPFYGCQRKVRTVQDALTVLGLSTIATTIAGIVLRKVIPSTPRLERFWDFSARAAQISGLLVQQLGARNGVQPEDAYTFALFRDCGIPIMMRKFPDYYDTLAEANREQQRTFTEIEEARHPTSHAIVGSLLAQSWWLPEETCVAIKHHHDFVSLRSGGGALPAAACRLIALAQLAERIVQRMTSLAHTCEWEKMGEPCLDILAIRREDLEELEQEIAERYAAIDALV